MQTSNLNLSVASWLWPFESVDDLMKAFRICSRYNEIDITVCRLINKFISKPISFDNLKTFQRTANSFPKLYPIDFVKNIDSFDEQVLEEIIKEDQASSDFVYENFMCSLCNNVLNGIHSKHTAVVYYLAKKAQKCNILSKQV